MAIPRMSKAWMGNKPITPREKEVLSLLLLGHSSEEIAQILHISKSTVDIHRIHIYEKVGINTSRNGSRAIVKLILHAVKYRWLTAEMLP